MTLPVRAIRLIPKSASELDKLSGSTGEIFLDKATLSLRIFDGIDRGGMQLLKADLSNLETTGGSEVDFGAKIIIAEEFRGDFTGQVSDISNHSLGDLGNVSSAVAANGNVLAYDGTNWVPISLTGGFNGGEISGSLKISNPTAATSTTTGALQVTGGVGIGGEIFSTGVNIRFRNILKLYDTDNTQFIGLRAPAAVNTDLTFTLPGTAGTAGQYLQTNGLGGLSWATVVSDGGGGGGGISNPPGGSNTFVQYNNNSAFGGSSTFTYDDTSDTVSVSNLVATESITGDVTGDVTGNVTGNVTGDVTGDLTGNVTSTNAVITGGAINNVPIGATTARSGKFTTLTTADSVIFEKTENSSSSATGAVVVAGGVGVTKDINVGGAVSVNTTINATGNITTSSNVVVNKLPTQTSHAANKQYVDVRSIAMAIAMS